MKNLLSGGLVLLFAWVFVGCALFRANPLTANRGAVVLILDTRTCGNLRDLRATLVRYDACATIFAAGQVSRSSVLSLYDLREAGCEIGISGLRAIDPERYTATYGSQKYFQDEIVPQLLGAEKTSLNPDLVLLPTLKSTNISDFLHAKGFKRVLHKLPNYIRPQTNSPEDFAKPLIHVYSLTSDNFDRSLIASLARQNRILVVIPDQAVLLDLLAEAREQNVPFATVSDLKAAR